MSGKVYFSFKCWDAERAHVVRDCWVALGNQAAGFIAQADVERIEKLGEPAVQHWIDNELQGTTVTVVLVGRDTCTSNWVRLEIEKSKARGNGLCGIDISMIADGQGQTTECCGTLPDGYPFHRWHSQVGATQLRDWIEQAAATSIALRQALECN